MLAKRLRPLTAADIYDEAFDLYKETFVRLVGSIAAILALSSWFFVACTPDGAGLEGLQLDNLDAVLPAWLSAWTADRSFSTWLIAAALFAGVGLLLYACFAGASSAYCGRLDSEPGTPPRPWKALLPFFAVYGALVALSAASILPAASPDLLPYIVVLQLAELLFVPFALFALVDTAAKRGPLGASIGRAWRLSRLAWGTTSGILFMASLVCCVAGSVLYGPCHLVVRTLVAPILHNSALSVATQSRAVEAVVVGVVAAIILPYNLCVAVACYFDARVRIDAFDTSYFAETLHYPDISTFAHVIPPVEYLPANRKTRGKKKS